MSIASTYPVLKFAVKYREKMFPAVPIVFFDVYPYEIERQKVWPGVTGLVVPLGMRETIDLALRLHPDTNAIAVITGVSEWERDWLELTHSELLRHRDKVREIDIIGNPDNQILQQIATLRPHTVVLFQLAPHDSNEAAFGNLEVLSAVAQRIPTYSVYSGLGLNRGAIGGAYRDIPKDVRLTGEIASRVLNGERPENISVVRDSDLKDPGRLASASALAHSRVGFHRGAWCYTRIRLCGSVIRRYVIRCRFGDRGCRQS